jgi:hypothetical protein
MSNDDLSARLDRVEAELYEALGAFSVRLSIIEDKLGLPMSYVDRIFAQHEVKRRQTAREAVIRRDEAFHKAEAEAARVGDNGPLDRFVQRLKAGEFDRPNGG